MKVVKFAGVVFCMLALVAMGVSCSEGNGESGPTYHTVTFISDGGSVVPAQKVENGKMATKPSPAPTKTGFTFNGWYNGVVEFDFSTPITADITLTAKWENLSQTTTKYTIKFDIAELADKIDNILKNRGERLTQADLPEPKNVAFGYVFKGWYKDAACSEAFTPFAVEDHTTLYAGFTDAMGNSVATKLIAYKTDRSYMDNKRTVADVLLPSYIIAPPTSVEDGYYFRGWYTGANSGATRAEPGMKITGDTVTLYAKWEKKIASASAVFAGIKFSDMDYVYSQSQNENVADEYEYSPLENTEKNTDYYLIAGVSECGADGTAALVFGKQMGKVMLRSDSIDGSTVASLRFTSSLNFSNSTAPENLLAYVQVHPTGAGTLTATLSNGISSAITESPKAKALFIDENGNVIGDVSVDNRKSASTDDFTLSCKVTKAGPVYLAFGRYGDAGGSLSVKKITFTAEH